VSGRPLALARALVKIHRVSEPCRDLRSLLHIHEDTETDKMRWLSTHPPLEERVDRLVALSETDPDGTKLQQLQPGTVR